MELDYRSFAFIITLAAVINGLGIVRWLTSFAEYLRNRGSLDIKHYWVYNLTAGFQFMFHVLMWWSLWGTHGSGAFNFLTYLYLLTGPVLLFLGTSLLVPDLSENSADLRAHYFRARTTYSTVLTMAWLWVIFLWPVLVGSFAPTVPIVLVLAILAATMRATANPKVHGVIAISLWLLLTTVVVLYGMHLGGVGALMS